VQSAALTSKRIFQQVGLLRKTLADLARDPYSYRMQNLIDFLGNTSLPRMY